MNINRESLMVVSIMPCIAKKFERTREEMENEGFYDVDNVITTRELARMIKQANIEFTEIEENDFDAPMGEATGAAAIFGTTGGVMEAALRTAVETITGKALENVEFTEVRGMEGVKEASYDVNGTQVKVAVVSGLKNASVLCDKVKNGEADYQFIEVISCPGGCVNGGGQPVHLGVEQIDVIRARQASIYNIDSKKELRVSCDNPEIKKIYDEYFPHQVKFAVISREEGKETIDHFWKANSLTLPYSAQSDRTVYNLFADSRIPRVYICLDGIIKAVFTDEPNNPTSEDIRSVLEGLI